jgi:DNA segregation ATPase FtsK/SpoIIIE, S-DNA-T family
MIDNRSPKSDLLALLLFLPAIFIGLSLATYSPADPVGPVFRQFDRWYQPDVVVWPQNQYPQNLFGRAGATASDLLYATLGVGAWMLVAGLVALAISLLKRRPAGEMWGRWAGWFIALVGLSTFASLLLPNWTPGPIIGPGGYLGALGAGLLDLYFSGMGGLILAGGLLLIGLFMWTDYLLVRVAAAGFAGTAAAVSATRRPASRLVTRERGTTADDEKTERRGRRQPENRIDDEAGGGAIAISTGRPSIVADIDDEPEDDSDARELPVDDDAATIPFKVRTAASAAVAVAETTDETGDEDDGLNEEDMQEKAAPPPRRGLFGSRKSAGQEPAPAEAPRAVAKPVDERTRVMSQLNAAAMKDDPVDYELPAIDLLESAPLVADEQVRQQILRRGKLLEQKFLDYGYKVRVVDIETGPVITQYEIELETGLRLSRIMSLSDDIAIGLRVPSVRIVAPIPGKNSVGIEVPNEIRQMVRLRDVMVASTEQTRKMKIPLFLGQDVSGNTLVADLARLPHLLIAGRTGTGKSVCLNAIISSILMTRRPDEVRMLMIDPKMVELSGYSRLPHLMHPVVTDMRKAEAILAWAVDKMEERYRLMARAGVRHLNSYNQLGEEELMERLQPADDDERSMIPVNMPFIVIIADEMADLMMTAGKEVEQHIIRLAQKSRAVGIHLILATQKPTVDVITGLIKSNLPSRIAFQVASQSDSRVVLDANGAEKLLGNGDMLFLAPGTSSLLRGQGTYLSDEEIEAITESVSTGEQHFVNELVNIRVEGDEDKEGLVEKLKNRDELYHRAVETVISEQRGSVSLLQRVLGVGYGRAARLIDFMEEDGVVGPYNGSKSRDIIMTMDQWLSFKAGSSGGSADRTAETPEMPPRTVCPRIARFDDIERPVRSRDEGEAVSYGGPRKKPRPDVPDEELEDDSPEDDPELENRGDRSEVDPENPGDDEDQEVDGDEPEDTSSELREDEDDGWHYDYIDEDDDDSDPGVDDDEEDDDARSR